MPTYRKLHTKIIDSYDFNEMPNDFTRVFWLLLTVTSDSEGRSIDNPAWLRSKMFPLREDVKNAQINDAVEWLASHKMIVRYEVNGRNYFYIPTWKTYQTGTEKEAKSNLPTPDLLQSNSRVSQEKVDAAASASVSVSVSEYASDTVNVSERPNIYKVYENEIGMLTPTIADNLEEAEKEYPAGWVEDALKEAAKNNKRSWAYAHAILKRWKVDGRSKVKSNGNGEHAGMTLYTGPNGEEMWR